VAVLPRVSSREAIRVFEALGYQVVRQTGSHVRLRHPTSARPPLTIPDHRELKTGLLRALIRDAGLTVEEFVSLLHTR
jgi:predicted RNA binding protein YcfA (HicA-like mRNA interferase family)